MHQIQFRLGVLPRPHWGDYSDPHSDPPGYKKPTSKGGDGKEWGMGGETELGEEEGNGEGEEKEVGREGTPKG